jgi:hypothetical protein
MPGHQIGGKRWQAVDLALRVAIFDYDVAALDVADIAQATPECLHQLRRIVRRSGSDEPDHRHGRLLRARRERPHGCAAEERDELAPVHSIEREPIDRMRARLEALLKANAAPRCGARSKRTGKPCQGAAMPNGRCKLHGGKSTGPRTPEGLERSKRARWKHGYYSREAKAERSRVRAAILAVRSLGDSI